MEHSTTWASPPSHSLGASASRTNILGGLGNEEAAAPGTPDTHQCHCLSPRVGFCLEAEHTPARPASVSRAGALGGEGLPRAAERRSGRGLRGWTLPSLSVTPPEGRTKQDPLLGGPTPTVTMVTTEANHRRKTQGERQAGSPGQPRLQAGRGLDQGPLSSGPHPHTRPLPLPGPAPLGCVFCNQARVRASGGPPFPACAPLDSPGAIFWAQEGFSEEGVSGARSCLPSLPGSCCPSRECPPSGLPVPSALMTGR